MSTNSLKELVGKRISKQIDFMGTKVTINKLSVSEVMNVQERAKNAGEDEKANFDLLKYVISTAMVGADELTTEDYDSFPLDELSRVSKAIMTYSGLSGEEGKAP